MRSDLANLLYCGGFNPRAVLKLCGYPIITSVTVCDSSAGTTRGFGAVYTPDKMLCNTTSYNNPQSRERALFLYLKETSDIDYFIRVCFKGARPQTFLYSSAPHALTISAARGYGAKFIPIAGYRLPDALVKDCSARFVRC